MKYTLPSYFNTTSLKGKKLQREIVTAKSQEKIILDYFKVKKSLSPSQVYRFRGVIGLGNAPITSIRRSITMLTYDDKLVKTEKQRIGLYGKPEFVWELKTGQIAINL